MKGFSFKDQRFDTYLANSHPWVTFRTYCQRSKRGPFYQVLIVKNMEEVGKAERALWGSRRASKKMLGHTAGFERPISKCCGVVIFSKEVATMIPVVSHELTHAAHFKVGMDYGDKIRLGSRKVTEPLADTMTWLQFHYWEAMDESVCK